ncbi:hypothetical protein ACS0TY_028669 [Phlomoides rotata]
MLTGSYYLCDGGYTNGNEFLSPYRGVRYHLKEWDNARQHQKFQEYFNLKHAKARNCIERSFGVLKARWGFTPSKPKIDSFWVVVFYIILFAPT